MALTNQEIDDFIAQGLTDEQISAVASRVDAQEGQNSVPAAISGQGNGGGGPAAPEPGFFSPEKVASRFGEGVKGSIPFAETAENVVKGEAPYSATPEGVGHAFGDVGGTAAAIASGGMLPLAKFAGLGGALNALGINAGAAKLGSGVEEAYNKAVATNAPSKILGIEGLGTALNFLTRGPGATADVAINALPYALAGKAIESKALPVKETGSAPAPASTPTTAELLAQHGGETTPAMRATSRIGKAVTGGIEKLAAGNPLTQALPEGIRTKNVAAVNDYLEKNLGSDVAGMTSADYAPNLQQTMKEYKGSRSAKFAEAEASLKGLDSKLPKPVGEMASDRIIAELKDSGVPFDEKGFNPDLMTGNEKIDPITAKALVAMERQVRNAKTIPDLLAQRQNIDRAGIPNFEAPPDAMGRLKNKARGIVNDTLTQAVESSGDKEAEAKWKAANTEYRDTAAVMKKAGKIQANELLGSEALTQMLTNPAQGGQALAKLKSKMAPKQWDSVQKSVANAILDKSRTADGIISADSLRTNINKKMATIFSQLDQKTQTVIRNAQEMMDKAQLTDLRRENPSGTAGQFGKGVHTASMFNPLAWPVLAVESGGIGGYYGANKVLPPVVNALKSAKTAAQGLINTPIPGTGKLSSGIPAIVLAAMAAQRHQGQQAR